MNQVTLCENTYDPQSWQTYEVEDVRAFLKQRFLNWPETAHIYLNYVAESADVTPYDAAGVERLGELEGHFWVVIYPEGIELIIAIVAIAVAAVAIGLAILLRPSPNVKNQQQESPNNSLSNRQNRERPNERIPDIYGQVWATPDLIALPYRIFIGNKEVEYMMCCIGRGEYDIAVVRDDLTPIEDIAGASIEVYGPNTSPNSGDDPTLRIGNPIATPVYKVKQFSSANGQVLRAPNANKFKADKNISFVYPDTIRCSAQVDFTEFFGVGSISTPNHLTLANAIARDPGSSATVDLSGTYEIADVQQNEIVLVNPALVNPNWNTLATFSGGVSTYGNPLLTSSDDTWIGPFVVSEPDVNQIWCNFVCPQGLYELDKDANQHSMIVEVEIGIQAIDADRQPVGTEIFYHGVIIGSATLRSQRALTLKCPLPLVGPCQVRARRISSTDLRDNWNVVDQTQWRDLYAVAPLGVTHFGNVTTIQAVTWPTQDALAIKERKLNCLIGRRIPKYKASHSFEGPYAVFDQTQYSNWNESLKRLVWCVDVPGYGSATTSVFGILINGVYSQVTLTGVQVGNSGGLDGQAVLTDATHIYACQFSGYDTSKWYKFPIGGGGSIATVGHIGVFGEYSIPHGIDLITYSGTQYIVHRRGSNLWLFETSGMTESFNIALTGGGDGHIVHDSSGNLWAFSATGIQKIDLSGPTVTNHALSLSGTIQNMTYVASDNSILIATATHLYKFDIATLSIINSIAFSSSGISYNVGADGNISNGGDLYNAETLALVSASNPLSNYGGTGTWSSFTFGLIPFQIYDSTNNLVYVRNTTNQLYGLYLGAPGFVFGTLAPSKNAAAILVAMALDPYIGNRQVSEVDTEGIFAAIGPSGENQAYFGTQLCSEFCYTFDDSKVSFEEMALDVGNAAFATIYRRGSIISAMFEKLTSNSVMLFNHRNKIPRSEVRTVNFGMPNDSDGIQLDFIDPKAPNQPDIDATSTLYFPTDKSAKSAKKITAIGVRNNVQAYMLGWRLFNKLRYQNTFVEFTATQEAAVRIPQERILIADNTRPDTQDGQVEDQVSLELTLSQPVTFVMGRTYTIFLQLYDDTVEAIGITAGSAANKVVLATAPTVPLVYDQNKFAQTTYIIVSDEDARSNAFLLAEKTADTGMKYKMKAGNYDDRFYDKDQDFVLGNVTENSGAGGYNAGYGAQLQTTVNVDGKTMPWMALDNPTFPYGINDGFPPVAVPLLGAAGTSISISAAAPGEPIQVWRWTFQTNTVKASDARDPNDANGEPDDITGTSISPTTGKRFPTYYDVGGFPLGLCGLMMAFAKKETTGKYTVLEVNSVGFNGTFVIPTDADTCLLGINDDHFSDNGGGFSVTVTQLGVTPGDPTPGTDTGDDTSGDVWEVDGSGPGELVPPAGMFLMADKFKHNTSAFENYNQSHFPETFTGVSTVAPSTTVSVDSSLMDDSQNPATPSHVSDAGPITLVPSAVADNVPVGVHDTPWFGKSGHIRIGKNCNTTAYAIAVVNDLIRRKFDFYSGDWYGQGSFEDEVLLKIQAYNATLLTPIKIVVCLDKGIAGLTQSVLQAQIDYVASQYFADGNYLQIGGHPLLQFFGVRDKIKAGLGGSDVAADAAMSAVKAATATAHWSFFEQSLRHKSYVDGCFDWPHPYASGVNLLDPYHLSAVDQFYADMADEPTKSIGACLTPGFNGTETYKVGWSLDKALPRNGGACWKAIAAKAEAKYNSQVKYVMVGTWGDYEEGTEIETGIDNEIVFASASITTHNLNWSVNTATADESLIYTYRVIASDGVFGQYIASVATGVGTYDLSTSTDLVSGKTYDIYVEAVGINSVRCKVSSKMTYTAA
jgi:hypothetical protein